MFLALSAFGLWLRYATLQNLIPSLPWIAPDALQPGTIQGKEGINFCHLATLHKVGHCKWDNHPSLPESALQRIVQTSGSQLKTVLIKIPNKDLLSEQRAFIALVEELVRIMPSYEGNFPALSHIELNSKLNFAISMTIEKGNKPLYSRIQSLTVETRGIVWISASRFALLAITGIQSLKHVTARCFNAQCSPEDCLKHCCVKDAAYSDVRKGESYWETDIKRNIGELPDLNPEASFKNFLDQLSGSAKFLSRW